MSHQTDTPTLQPASRIIEQSNNQTVLEGQTNEARDGEDILDDGPARQNWTQSGFPVVDGKYLDTSDGGTIKTLGKGEWTVFGPPVIDVYWHNRSQPSGSEGARFRGCAMSASVNVTEYMIRVGEFFRVTRGSCELLTLNATTYSVNVIVNTDISTDEWREFMAKCGLSPAM